MSRLVAAALLAAATAAVAPVAHAAADNAKTAAAPPPAASAPPSAAAVAIDAVAYPSLDAMLKTLRNSSQSSNYCARTGGMFLEADRLVRLKRTEKDVVAQLVADAKDRLKPNEVPRYRELATAVTQMAAGFESLAPESAAVAYTQTCLASTRSAAGTRNQAELDQRFRHALACDKQHTPGTLDGKECVAKAFHYP
jgi:hypothetical protein